MSPSQSSDASAVRAVNDEAAVILTMNDEEYLGQSPSGAAADLVEDFPARTTPPELTENRAQAQIVPGMTRQLDHSQQNGDGERESERASDWNESSVASQCVANLRNFYASGQWALRPMQATTSSHEDSCIATADTVETATVYDIDSPTFFDLDANTPLTANTPALTPGLDSPSGTTDLMSTPAFNAESPILSGQGSMIGSSTSGSSPRPPYIVEKWSGATTLEPELGEAASNRGSVEPTLHPAASNIIRRPRHLAAHRPEMNIRTGRLAAHRSDTVLSGRVDAFDGGHRIVLKCDNCSEDPDGNTHHCDGRGKVECSSCSDNKWECTYKTSVKGGRVAVINKPADTEAAPLPRGSESVKVGEYYQELENGHLRVRLKQARGPGSRRGKKSVS